MVDYLVWAVALLVVLFVCLAAWRFVSFRSRGSQVIVRKLPARGTHGWRHGVIRYRGDQVEYFKLRSVSPSPDFVALRRELSLSGRREKTTAEQRFMEPEKKILVLDDNGTEYEWAMDPHGEMALLAWLESASTRPIIRTDPRRVMKYFGRDDQR